MTVDKSLLRSLPAVDELLRACATTPALENTPRWAITAAVRRLIDKRRSDFLAGRNAQIDPITTDEIVAMAEELMIPSLRPVINATGVVVHTNLGRAPLPEPAMRRLEQVALGYCNLEYELDRGHRGSRHGHLQGLAADLCGAEDAVVVNNNAAAVLLTISSLAAEKDVLVSRGELVEIGGGFRIPEVITQGGARLKEVGTTNRTRISDYEQALDANTGALLKVHQSNFALVGFVEETPLADLAALGRVAGVPVVVDLGSGAMATSYGLGLEGEPTVRATLRAGADLVTFSGDKLVGGPQAGIILGREDLVSAIRRHPLMRAVRPGKLDLIALEATLSLWRDGQRSQIPVASMLGQDPKEAKRRALRFRKRLHAKSPGWSSELWQVHGRAGGGSLPLGSPPGWALALSFGSAEDTNIEAALRGQQPAVITRIVDERVLLDLRTVLPHQEKALLACLDKAGTQLDQAIHSLTRQPSEG